MQTNASRTRRFQMLQGQVADASLAQAGARGLPRGIHRGALAGLDEAARRRAIDAALDGGPIVPVDVVRRLVRSRSAKSAPRAGLAEGLAAYTAEQLRSSARFFDVKGASSMRKADLVRALEGVAADMPMLRAYLLNCTDDVFDAFSRAVSGEGPISRPEGSTAASRLRPDAPFTLGFCHEGTYSFVVPEEVAASFSREEWGLVERDRGLLQRLTRVAEGCAQLYGIIPLAEVARIYNGRFGSDLSASDVDTALRAAMEWRDLDLELWHDGTGACVTDPLLSFEFNLFGDGPEAIRELIGYRREILERHGLVERAPFPEALCSQPYYEWVTGLAPVVGFRSWLDAHVPDGANDLFFADSVIERLVEACCMPQGPSELPRILSDAGLFVSQGVAGEAMSAAMPMVNGIPCWVNNGHAPQELHARETGRMLAFGADGTSSKIGRNDPCPCGSGKKYKRCCGR